MKSLFLPPTHPPQKKATQTWEANDHTGSQYANDIEMILCDFVVAI